MKTAPTFVWAASQGLAACIQALCDAGEDVNQQARSDGARPLFIAAQHGHADCVRVLCCEHAYVNHCMTDGTTPLFIAAQNGHADCIQALCDEKAAVNQGLNDGTTSLHAAAQRGHTDCVRALCVAGAAVNVVRVGGTSPLYAAVQEGQVDCAQVLLEAGADVNQATNDGVTPLDITTQEGVVTQSLGHLGCASLLSSRGGRRGKLVHRSDDCCATPGSQRMGETVAPGGDNEPGVGVVVVRGMGVDPSRTGMGPCFSCGVGCEEHVEEEGMLICGICGAVVDSAPGASEEPGGFEDADFEQANCPKPDEAGLSSEEEEAAAGAEPAREALGTAVHSSEGACAVHRFERLQQRLALSEAETAASFM